MKIENLERIIFIKNIVSKL